MVMGIDDNLLNKRSSDVPSDKKSEENEAALGASDSSIDANVDDRTAEFIQNQVEARQKKAAEAAETANAQKKAETAKPNPVNSCSGSCLKKAWLNLIPSWGLTLIWINIHAFLSTVLGEKMFCKLGMEWVPEQLKKAQFEEAKKLGKVAGTFEGGGLACLDLGCLLIIIGVAAIVYTLFDNIFVKFFAWVIDLLD